MESINHTDHSECSPRPMSDRQPFSDDNPEEPWTAGRCDRLLQNLQSNINALRELPEFEQAIRLTKKQEKEVESNAGGGSSNLSDSATTRSLEDGRIPDEFKRLGEVGNEW